MKTRQEERNISGKKYRATITTHPDGSELETLSPIPEQVPPSIAVFDKKTGDHIFSMESSRAIIDKHYADLSEKHHCLRDVVHKVKNIENYRHHGDGKLIHKHDKAKNIDLKEKP